MTSAAHTIRLRGPWRYVPLARTVLLSNGKTAPESGEVPAAGRLTIPADWGATLGRDFRGRVRYLRRFARPTGLAPEDRVELVVERLDAFGTASLNGRLLGPISMSEQPARFDITSSLEPRNELAIEVELPRLTRDSPALHRAARDPSQPGGLVGEVRLEISEVPEVRGER